MRSIKYIVFALLILAILELNAYPVVSTPLARVALAGAFLVYGLWALLLFRKSVLDEPTQTQRTVLFSLWTRTQIRLISIAAYLLIVRIAFMFCAFAYLAQSLTGYDSTMLTAASRQDFPAFLIAVFDQTFPPLTALTQFVVPSLRPVTWSYGNVFTLLLRLAAYALFAVTVVSVVREVWHLRGDVDELAKRVKLSGRRYPTD
jgi:hypothetical protein